MLTSENLFESLIDQMKVTDIFDSLLFQWNSNQKCFQLKSNKRQGVYKVRLVISATYTLLVLLQITWTWKNISIFVKLHSMFLFTGLLLFIYTHSVFCSKAELIVSYLNGMLIFEHQRKGYNWNSNVTRSKSKLTKIVMKIMAISGIVGPLLHHADMFRNPCLPICLGGYWNVDTQCGGQIGTDLRPTWSISEIWIKSQIMFVNYINWSFLVSGSYFHLTLALLLKSYCMKAYILLAGQKICESLTGTRKTNWHTCLIYREIEVMSTEYRRLYSCYMTVVVLISSIIVHTISLYACFKFGFMLPLPMLFLFAMTALNAGLVIVSMFSCLANVFKASRNVLEIQLKSGNGNCIMQPSQWYRRYLKSCKIVKVYIGNTNFVEPLTPLTIEQFCIDQTISLMLLQS